MPVWRFYWVNWFELFVALLNPQCRSRKATFGSLLIAQPLVILIRYFTVWWMNELFYSARHVALISLGLAQQRSSQRSSPVGHARRWQRRHYSHALQDWHSWRRLVNVAGQDLPFGIRIDKPPATTAYLLPPKLGRNVETAYFCLGPHRRDNFVVPVIRRATIWPSLGQGHCPRSVDSG